MAENQQSVSSRRSSREGRGARKPKKNQIPIGIGVVLGAIVVAILLFQKSANLGLFWLTGLAFGFILQKGRFCFTASMRDPYLTGSTSITRAVIIALAITMIGFTAIKYGYGAKGLPMPGMGYVAPISFATLIGAFIFGVGMVIAGGCASGTLMRVGEGFFMNLLALLFFIIGSLIGANHFGWWKANVISKGVSVFLPDVLGWMGGLLVPLIILFILYIVADKYEKKRTGSN